MNFKSSLIVGSSLFFLTFSGLASAATYKSYNCSDRSCEYSYRLPPSQTKEFRIRCKNGSEPDVNMHQREHQTTCTKWGLSLPYMSRSCTNWDATSSDRFSILVKCGAQAEKALHEEAEPFLFSLRGPDLPQLDWWYIYNSLRTYVQILEFSEGYIKLISQTLDVFRIIKIKDRYPRGVLPCKIY